jgi:two-component system chemotaxis response regulator CheY
LEEERMSEKRILSIGQCGADHAAIARTLQRHFGADVVPAEDWAEALPHLRGETFNLVLVNRLLDASGSDGLEIIKEIKADEELRRLSVMLVSNLDDAQADAIAAGAERGFGKAALGQPAMVERLRPFIS